jgi:hypothetical protein
MSIAITGSLPRVPHPLELARRSWGPVCRESGLLLWRQFEEGGTSHGLGLLGPKKPGITGTLLYLTGFSVLSSFLSLSLLGSPVTRQVRQIVLCPFYRWEDRGLVE